MLVFLALVGVLSVVYAEDKPAICLLIFLSYLNNTSYSMVSRSSMRDSALYHAFTTLLSSVAWYAVLHYLVTENMTLAFFVPYTVATVWGSFTGATASMKVEKFFGITTSTEKKKSTPQSRIAKKVLLGLLGVIGIVVAIYAENTLVSLMIASMSFGSGVIFTIVRRSRNTSNTTYHIFASLAYSALWYLVFRTLSLEGMPIALFVPYAFGGVLGGLFGQQTSAAIERFLGATTDSHVNSENNISLAGLVRSLPLKAIAILVLVVIAFVAFSENSSVLIMLASLSAAQQIAFSLVSRSRQRNNMTYHIIASIFSNSVWFLTFRQLHVEHWTSELYVPYAAGGAVGSVTGVAISMGIEKKLQATSEV